MLVAYNLLVNVILDLFEEKTCVCKVIDLPYNFEILVTNLCFEIIMLEINNASIWIAKKIFKNLEKK